MPETEIVDYREINGNKVYEFFNLKSEHTTLRQIRVVIQSDGSLVHKCIFDVAKGSTNNTIAISGLMTILVYNTSHGQVIAKQDYPLWFNSGSADCPEDRKNLQEIRNNFKDISGVKIVLNETGYNNY